MTTLSFEALWKDRGATAGLKNLAAGTKAARVSYDDLRTATVRAAGAMKNAQLNIADATRAVAVQEARLKEARASGTAKASQILAIEDRLAAARRREADATEAAKRASVNLTQAQEREQRALHKTSLASVAASHAFKGLNAGATLAGKGGMRALGDGASVASRGLGKVTSVLGSLASGGLAAVGIALAAGGAAAVGFGVKVASGNEQARISFTTMLGSAKKADVFLRQLQKFAAATPFEFPELQTAASSLISAGINANKVIPIMRTLGDVTSGMGTGSEGIKRATIALQQMNAAGKITGEDLNQLRDAGIPVYDLLAAATGKSKAKIVELAAAGKLGKKELTQLMTALADGKGLERFNGLMDKQSKSLAGMFSTLKDTAGQAFGELAKSAFPLMKSGLRDISAGLGHLSDWVKDNRDSLGTVFKVTGTTLRTLGGTAWAVFKSIAGSVVFGKGSFKDFADWVATHQEDITKKIIDGGKAFVRFGITVVKTAAAGLRGFGTFADGIGDATAFILGQYADMAHGAALAFGWIPGIGPKLQAADVKFRLFATNAHNNSHRVGNAARDAAAGIEGKLLPGLNKAGTGLDAYGKKAITAAHSRDIVAKAEKRHEVALDAATKAAKDNGKTLDSNTISGRANRTALANLVGTSQNYIGKLIATHAGSKRVTAATKDAKEEFIRVATKMGVSSARAKDLADKYFKIPKKVETKTSAPGAVKAKDQIKDVDKAIENTNGKKVTVGITVNTSLNKLNRAIVKQYGKFAWKADFAGGGVMPGFTPGRDVHRFYSPTAGELNLSGGEAVMRPEWTRAVGGAAAVDRMNADAKSGRGPGFAGGGTVSRNITAGVAMHGRTIDYPKLRDRASRDSLSAASDMTRQTGRQATRDAMNAAIAAAKTARAAAQATSAASGSVASYSAGMAGTIARLRAAGARSFTTYPGHHPSMAKARDVTPHNWKIANVARASKSVWYVIYRMKIASKNHGNNWRPYHPISNRGDFRHTRHIHVAWYDKGGLLREGQAAVNRSGGTERVLTHRQNRNYEDLVRVMDRRGGGAGSTTINVNVPGGWIGSQDQFKQMLVDMNRRGQLEVIKR